MGSLAVYGWASTRAFEGPFEAVGLARRCLGADHFAHRVRHISAPFGRFHFSISLLLLCLGPRAPVPRPNVPHALPLTLSARRLPPFRRLTASTKARAPTALRRAPPRLALPPPRLRAATPLAAPVTWPTSRRWGRLPVRRLTARPPPFLATVGRPCRPTLLGLPRRVGLAPSLSEPAAAEPPVCPGPPQNGDSYILSYGRAP